MIKDNSFRVEIKGLPVSAAEMLKLLGKSFEYDEVVGDVPYYNLDDSGNLWIAYNPGDYYVQFEREDIPQEIDYRIVLNEEQQLKPHRPLYSSKHQAIPIQWLDEALNKTREMGYISRALTIEDDRADLDITWYPGNNGEKFQLWLNRKKAERLYSGRAGY